MFKILKIVSMKIECLNSQYENRVKIFSLKIALKSQLENRVKIIGLKI